MNIRCLSIMKSLAIFSSLATMSYRRRCFRSRCSGDERDNDLASSRVQCLTVSRVFYLTSPTLHSGSKFLSFSIYLACIQHRVHLHSRCIVTQASPGSGAKATDGLFCWYKL